MQVSVGLDASLVFCGDTIAVVVEFKPPEHVHILSATLSLQTTLHLGDLVNGDVFSGLRARGPVIGHHETQGRGLLGVLGLGAQRSHLYSLYRSEQQLLCADQHLSTRAEYSASFEIPRDLCPTYISKSLEIVHQVALEFQILRNGRPAPCLLLLPFRVFPRPSTAYAVLSEPLRTHTPREPVRERVKMHVASLLAGAREITPTPDEPLLASGLPTQCKYELVKNKQPLATLHLARPFISVGGVLVAIVELTSSCYHLTVTLEHSELIDAQAALANTEHKRVIASQSSVVWGLRQTTLQLPIPLQLVPQVELDVLRTGFALRVDLVCTASPPPLASPSVSTELVSTSIPITIVAPSEGGTPASRSWTM